MRKLYLAMLFVLLSRFAFAQTTPVVTTVKSSASAAPAPAAKAKAALPPALPFREVSGIVIDSTEEVVPGALVTLIAQKDTLRLSANQHGVFVFHAVKTSIFSLIVKGLSYGPFSRNYKYSDLQKNIVLDPVMLKTNYRTLKVIQIQGVIGIVYKTDTAEYTASDYKVRENATVDELLKKMEGVEVSSTGKVTYQGQDVTKAKVNGKAIGNGNVAQAIQNLPANIVEKVQFVNDYGPQAERTGIKDGDPQVILNITTLAAKSVGNIARINLGAGNDDRYDERISLQRINANQTISFIGNIRNTVNGVAPTSSNTSGVSSLSSSGYGGGTGGNTTAGNPTLSYNDQWGKHIKVNTSYSFNFTNLNVTNNSNGTYYSSRGNTNFNSNGDNQSKVTGHNFNFDFQYSPDSADYIGITPRFTYSGTHFSGNSQQELTGHQNEGRTGYNSGSNTSPNYGGYASYQRLFKKKGRNIYAYVNVNVNDQQQVSESNANILYRDSTTQRQLRDSVHHFIVSRSNFNNSTQGYLSYGEPLTATARLSFTGQYSYRSYDNTATTDSVNRSGILVHAPSFSNIFQYSFAETRLGFSYSVTKIKYAYSVGFTAIPSVLQGSKQSLNTVLAPKRDFHLIPIARYEYKWSKTQAISINYSGYNTEPTFDQIQPVADKSNPPNVVVGNPDLKPSFNNSINLRYNNYLSNARLAFSAGVGANFVNNQVIYNNIQIPIPSLQSDYTETHFLNINGTYSFNGNYSISKQFADQKYLVALNGNVTNNHSFSMSNSILYPTTSWRFSERLGPQINPNQYVEINANLGFEANRTFYSQPTASDIDTKIETINIDGRFFIGGTWRIGYSAVKSYVQGISYNSTKNPFVLNGYLEKEFFAKKNGILRLQIFDLLNQNNFINQTSNEYSVTNSSTNTQSRYLFLSFIINLQKWTGAPKKNGQQMLRRGDGSFIY